MDYKITLKKKNKKVLFKKDKNVRIFRRKNYCIKLSFYSNPIALILLSRVFLFQSYFNSKPTLIFLER